MSLTYKIKAKSQDEAVIKGIKEYKFSKEDVLKVEELQKPSSFFGFFKKDGEFKLTIEKKEDNSEITELDELNEKVNNLNQEVVKEKPSEYKVEKIVVKKATKLLEQMGLDLKVEVLEVREHYVLVDLCGNDNGIIIGKKGKTLNSFEYLLNSLCKSVKVEVDVQGFKAKRAETLRDLARKMSEKALNTNKTVKLNPMPPRERKIIHEIVNKYKELDTFSEGRDPKRYIVIKRKRMG